MKKCGCFALACTMIFAVPLCAETFGPDPYLSSVDSPLSGLFSNPNFFLEDFEDGLLNTPGVTASDGMVLVPSGVTDSVDGDDGVIDGFGTDGHSFWSGFPNGTGVTFTFDDAVLGAYPLAAGIVFTDSVTGTTIEFLDASNAVITTFGPLTDSPDTNGETAGDRFVGVFNAGGISAISVVDPGRAFEVDHLQYGVPEPSAVILSVVALMILLGSARVRGADNADGDVYALL